MFWADAPGFGNAPAFMRATAVAARTGRRRPALLLPRDGLQQHRILIKLSRIAAFNQCLTLTFFITVNSPKCWPNKNSCRFF
jgi:hypothetical protein